MRILNRGIIVWGLLFVPAYVAMAQDNGNLFQKTWGANESVFEGDWGELAVYAPEGLDIDQDNHREFIVYDHVTGVFFPEDRLQLWENRGDNDFFLAWEHKYTDVKSQFQQGHAIAAADLDFDGKQEVLIVTESVLYIYEWNGTAFEAGAGLPQEATCRFEPFQDNTGTSPIRQLRVVNLDPDPEPELFFGYSTNVGMYVSIASLANRDFANPEWKDEYADPFSVQDAWRVGGVAVDDFDGDGKMEMFTTHWQDAPTTRLYENDGIDNYVIKFTTLPSTLVLDPPYDDSYANPIFHDFDGDGDSEFVITDIHGKMFVITKQASNNFEDFGPSAWKYVMTFPEVLMNGFVRSGFLHDLDQDGKPDIYYNDKGAVGKGGVYDLEYQGGLVTSPDSWKVYKIYDNNGHMSVAGEVYPAGDLDGDGRGELVVVAWSNQPQDLVVVESLDKPSPVENKNQIPLPGECVLHQNYPNPFNSTTRIAYDIPHPALVRLMMYSVNGQYIATLVDERQSAGLHTAYFDATRLPAGIYTYRILAGEWVQQKKMLYLK
jgi:hypothetical protein